MSKTRREANTENTAPVRHKSGLSAEFAECLIAWQQQHGRNDLPWQNTHDAYRIWLSEIMLQQTQVATVIPYYGKFLERFPDVKSLAEADLDEVLQLWSGLGYYSRARNLHAAAGQVMAQHGGRFPHARAALEALPGLGRSTAAAVAVFAFGAREAILDGNVKRVLARHFAIPGYYGEKKVADQLWSLAESLLPARGVERYTQSLMDLGATVCTRAPACASCPVKDSCVALAQDAVLKYPSPRPRKSVPERTTVMLLLEHKGEVLLQQRPPSGIWGGLWAFPEPAAELDIADYCAQQLGCNLSGMQRLPELAHAFTHFKLSIQPVLCRVGTRAARAESGLSKWLPLAAAEQAAVPTPVRKLLRQLAQELVK